MRTLPKPAFLGQAFGDQFRDDSVVAAYDLRPPYPTEVFDVLERLVDRQAPVVLDVGCGTGEIARAMAGRGFRVDAVDPSAGMIAKGRGLPGGDAANLRWIVGMAEDAPLSGPYGLIVAGASLHWMEWDVVLPRFRDVLAERGYLAIVDQRVAVPWSGAVGEMCARYSTNRDWAPYSAVEALTARGLFAEAGREATEPVFFRQLMADYVDSFHARNGFSRDRMRFEDAAAFDRDVEAVVREFVGGDEVELPVVGTVTWGLPGAVV